MQVMLQVSRHAFDATTNANSLVGQRVGGGQFQNNGCQVGQAAMLPCCNLIHMKMPITRNA